MIVAEGSKLKHATFCLSLEEPARLKRQRVRLALCDEESSSQKFQVTNGIISPLNNTEICAGFEYSRLRDGSAEEGVPLVFSKCYLNNFALE